MSGNHCTVTVEAWQQGDAWVTRTTGPAGQEWTGAHDRRLALALAVPMIAAVSAPGPMVLDLRGTADGPDRTACDLGGHDYTHANGGPRVCLNCEEEEAA